MVCSSRNTEWENVYETHVGKIELPRGQKLSNVNGKKGIQFQ